MLHAPKNAKQTFHLIVLQTLVVLNQEVGKLVTIHTWLAPRNGIMCSLLQTKGPVGELVYLFSPFPQIKRSNGIPLSLFCYLNKMFQPPFFLLIAFFGQFKQKPVSGRFFWPTAVRYELGPNIWPVAKGVW